MPQYLELTLSLCDSVYEKYKEFVMTIPVESKYGQFESDFAKAPTDRQEEKNKQEEVEKKKEKKPAGKT